jgi:hypothetical protein
MTRASRQTKIEYGDFQTPLDLATKVCQKLVEIGISPDIVIEPTCGIGAFVEASANLFPSAKKIIGVEINKAYLDDLKNKKCRFPQSQRITINQGNFFDFNWKNLLGETGGSILVIGNFPWVTNSQQGAIGGANLPAKLNFQNHNGLEAITGKSNFDISEWMLIQTAHWLQNRKGYLAMLCKTSVARKFLNYLYSKQLGVSRSAIYSIDAKQYFGASVEACLLFCEFDSLSHNYDYDIYESLDSLKCQRVGHRNGITVRNIATFERLSGFYGTNEIKWRSGVKHDCSAVMEFRELNGSYINGLGETVDIEPTFLFPLLKGSDIANNRISTTNRYLLVTQKAVGEPTETIKQIAPKTWSYLEAHSNYLDKRKSRIYQNSPRYSIFGVGSYTFAPYKIAICGLYKNLDFRLVTQINGKPVVFDDTVYFLSFDSQKEASKTLNILTSSAVREFYSTLIFWDEKRPIKAGILNCLDLRRVENAQNNYNLL